MWCMTHSDQHEHLYTWLMHVLELFVSEHCPGCPDAIATIEAFCLGRTDVVLVRHDVAHALEHARSYGLFATPALVIDGTGVMYGVPSIAALERHCAPVAAHTSQLGQIEG